MPDVPSSLVDKLIASASVIFHVSPIEIRGKDRYRLLVDARRAIVYLASQKGMSLPDIARHLGDRDHTSILSAKRSAEAILQNPEKNSMYRLFSKRVQALEKDVEDVEKALRSVPVTPSTAVTESTPISLYLPAKVRERLDVLLESECYGDSVAEVIIRILSDRVYELVDEVHIRVDDRYSSELDEEVEFDVDENG